MTNYIFDKALQHVLKWEGYISDDKNDTGGLTIWGISSKSHKKAVIKMKELIDAGLKNEAFAICKKIYWEVYWIKTGCDEHTYPMNICMFDTAVNMGRSRAHKLYDESLGWEEYLLRRLYTYSKFRQAKLYFRGWANRTLDLWKFIMDDVKKGE